MAEKGRLISAITDWHVHTSLIDASELAGSVVARVLDLGADPHRVKENRVKETNHPKTGPETLYAGAFLTAPGGYPSDRGWAEPGSWRFVANIADAQTHVAEMASLGACVIKVALNEAAGPVLKTELVQAIVAAAAQHDLPVVAHAEGVGQAEKARLAGAKYLAHTPFAETLTDEEITAQAANVAWISTLDIHGWGEETAEFLTAIDNLARFVTAGGSVLYGTDMGNGPTITGLNPREIAALKKAGMSEDQIISALTGPAPGIAAVASGPQVFIPGEPGQLDFAAAKLHHGMPK